MNLACYFDEKCNTCNAQIAVRFCNRCCTLWSNRKTSDNKFNNRSYLWNGL